jgi:hypothetical protein
VNKMLEEGAQNCAVDCARVKRGNQVYIVNETGTVDEKVSDVIEEIVKRESARAIVVWETPIAKGSSEIPRRVLEAYTEGEVVISHFPSLKREALYPYVQGDTRPRATNRAVSVNLLQSEWARFPYGLQAIIIKTIDDILAQGKDWHITSPNGTDVKGRVGTSTSRVAQAYFTRGEDDSRASRNFPGGVHTPLVSAETRGVIVVDHANVRGGFRPTRPIRIELKEGKVVEIQGGDDAGTIIKELEKTDGYLDSWHAGTNPKTITPATRGENPTSWWTYVHCSPMVLHFHLGRTHAPVNVASFNQTVTIDGRKIYDQGKLAVLDELEIQKAARNFDTSVRLFDQSQIDLG